MQLGMIGLGRMGANMVRRLQKSGHKCVVYDRSADSVKQLEGEGATGATSIDDFVKKLQKRSEEHTSELQSLRHLVCRLLLEKKKKKKNENIITENNNKNNT